MIKKVVIPAAGQGTRMKHLCKNKPKSLICVQQKPFLAYLFDNLLAAGYKEFILVVGFLAEQMEKFLKDFGYKATIVNQFDILGPKEKEYGTLCPLKCVRDLIGNENFLWVCGDNLFSVRDLKAIGINDDYIYVGSSITEHPEKYGVLLTDKQGVLKEIVEKPKEYIGNLVNKGLYKFTPEIFKQIPKVRLSPRGEYELTDAITEMAKQGKVKVKMLQDFWLDFGNPGDIIKVSNFLKNKKTCK
ncbi:MAG: sugar phosphate nucleotidyltransferase [Patescibacteria group bacterium]|nr:sugar phosphate nucleotidyltransferase [Patescibacteria group bacterium]